MSTTSPVLALEVELAASQIDAASPATVLAERCQAPLVGETLVAAVGPSLETSTGPAAAAYLPSVATSTSPTAGWQPAPAVKSGTPFPNAALLQQAVVRETHSWGRWLLGLGVLQLLASANLDRGWGVVMIVLGGAAFYFHDLGMLPVLAVTVGWAALSNLLTGQLGWTGLALFQVYLTYSTFSHFVRYQRAARVLELEAAETAVSDGQRTAAAADRAAPLFPWISLALGSLSVVSFAACFLALMIASAGGVEPSMALFGPWLSVTYDMGMLGIAFGISALLNRFRYAGASWLGLATGAFVLAVSMLFRLVG